MISKVWRFLLKPAFTLKFNGRRISAEFHVKWLTLVLVVILIVI